MSTVAFIPARGGSKGLLGKNIKNIAGKPLIAWSIEQALASKEIDEVFVSTDSQDIAEISKMYGASVPFLRPSEISGDLATTESAMLHFIEWLKCEGIVYDNIVLMQATSPVRLPLTLDQALSQFNESGCDSMVTVVPNHRFFWKNMAEPTPTYDFENRPRRQDINDRDLLYMETGSFYVTKVKSFLNAKCRLCGTVGMHVMKEEEAYEIDSMTDFIICETILNKFIVEN